MNRKNCTLCGQFYKSNHRCKKRIIQGVPTALIRPKGYSPKELVATLNGLRGTNTLDYNPHFEADRMERALAPVKGLTKRLKRKRLRSSLETRFGTINWGEA